MASSITFTITNPAVSTEPAAVLYINVAANLTMVLTNGTGQDIDLPANGDAFSLVAPRCFTVTQIQAATLTVPAGLTATQNGNGFAVSTGSSDYIWSNGATLTCTLCAIQSVGPAGTYFFSLEFEASGLPKQLTAKIALQSAPVVENPDLSSVLAVTFQPDGFNEVYVSTIQPYLQNTLIFNINNQSNAPIFTGNGNPDSPPQVIASFTYGSDDGSLTPTDVIVGASLSITSTEGNAWTSAWNAGDLSWTLTAPAADPIGTGSGANVTFQFQNIVALTAAGNMTQLMLQFINFQQTDTIAYNPWLFFLPIDKLVGPEDRGVYKFTSPTIELLANSPTDELEIGFTWMMNFVARVKLCYVLGDQTVTAIDRSYNTQSSGATDSGTVTVPGITQDGSMSVTLCGYDENGIQINSQQYRVSVRACYFLDTRDQTVYPATPIGQLLWMTQNLTWDAPNAAPPNGSSDNVAVYGRLYRYDDANSLQSTGGWRLPTQADWQTLTDTLDFDQLIASGLNSPALELAGSAMGTALSDLTYYGCGDDGTYWTSTIGNSTSFESPMVQILIVEESRYGYDQLPTETLVKGGGYFWLAVRYVRDLPVLDDAATGQATT
ncbi:MAG: FISUMP domain-containing protein [Rhizomicrobium sp.]